MSALVAFRLLFMSRCMMQRSKISAIIQRGAGVADPDAPSDPASTRFWCSTMGKATERESVSIAATASAAVAPTAESVGALLGPSGMPALADATPGAGNGAQASLQALVGVMNASREEASGRTATTAASKAKPKPKGKPRVTPLTTKTPEELRNTIRNSDVIGFLWVNGK